MSKRILVTFMNNGDLKNSMEAQAMWFKLQSLYGHLAKTRVIAMPHKKLIEYEDGTVIEFLPLSQTQGKRVHELYIHESAPLHIKTYMRNFVIGNSANDIKVYGKDDLGLTVKTFKGE